MSLPARARPGSVELWPPVAGRRAGAARRAAGPPRRAASPSRAPGWPARIAATIAGWLRDRRTAGTARAGRLRAGDIMVLVRRRDAFVADLVRALKQRGVPVAGADRLTLAEELAVQDLVALGQFLLLPEDDLTLGDGAEGPAVRHHRRRTVPAGL